jgi:hypothetical protein
VNLFEGEAVIVSKLTFAALACDITPILHFFSRPYLQFCIRFCVCALFFLFVLVRGAWVFGFVTTVYDLSVVVVVALTNSYRQRQKPGRKLLRELSLR